MEVVSIISPNAQVFLLLNNFIHKYSKLTIINSTHDTWYFSKKGNVEPEIYYHFLQGDATQEFTYNYSQEDVREIVRHFKSSEDLKILDISIRDDQFFKLMMSDFVLYLNKIGRVEMIGELLLSHFTKGIMTISDYLK